MPTLRALPADDPVSHELLTLYFARRAEGFPGGGYRTVFPDPAAFEQPNGVFLVLFDDTGEAIGCGGIRRIADGPAGVRYELKHLFVRPEARGSGGGRLLVTELEARARAFGAAELVLDTHHSLEAAGSLYARSGFIAIEPYNDNQNATRWYGKVLSDRS